MTTIPKVTYPPKQAQSHTKYEQPCRICASILEHYHCDQDPEAYAPYNTWETTSPRSHATLRHHAYECRVCGHKWTIKKCV